MEDPSASAETDAKQYAVIPQSTYCLENATVVDVRQEILRVYESYCVAYPNPSLAIENEERDRLLRAISAADHAIEVNPKKKQKRGFFGSLFGSSNSDDDRTHRRVQVQDDDDRLDYSPTEPLPPDTWLLGTEFSLDTSNIPDDAHSVARQHLLARQPNIMRGSTAVLVAAGVLAWDGATIVLPMAKDGPPICDTEIPHARAALIHPHLLAVSWRAADTEVVLYELVMGDDEVTGEWQPVAGFGPTPEVQAHLRNTEWDFEDENDETTAFTSTLLAVTDVLAWNEATLVVARLGGFIEVIPLGLGREEPPIAVTTAEYHVDVLGVEAVSECVLAAHGRTLDHHQVITFWNMEDDGMTLLQEIDVDRLGPDVSIFCTPIILQHWRKPRAVSLRRSSDPKDTKEAAVTTISVSAPIVSLQCRDGQHLAILDWNGGVSILDCNFADSQFQIFRSRAASSPVGVRSIQWIDADLVMLNREGRLLWHDATIASVPVYSAASLADQHIVVQNNSKLHICSIQELTATAIVQSFVMNEQFAEALAAARRLGQKERRTIDGDIEQCKRELWERHGDLDVLSSMHDDAYVIQQALDETPSNVDFPSVCRLALERMQTTRLGASLSMARTLEEFQGLEIKIQDRLLKYGTYKLLCDHLSVECLLGDFFNKFADASVATLARQLARDGDIVSSSLLWFRHITDIDAWDLLEHISLSVTPVAYQHLLPTRTPGKFLESAASTVEISKFPSYFRRHFDSPVVMDDEDEAMVVARALEWAVERGAKEHGDMVSWYATRLSGIAEHVPTLHNISAFGALALRALESTSVEEAPELFQLSCYAKTILALVSGHALGHNPSASLVSLAPSNLNSLPKSDLVSLVLDCPIDTAANRLHNVLVPFLRTLDPLKESAVLFRELDQAVANYIRNSLQAFIDYDCVTNGSFISGAQRCSDLVWASRSSLNKSNRLLSNHTTLYSLVLQLVGTLLEIFADVDLALSQQTQVMGALWVFFESLPTEVDDAPCEVGVLSNQLYNVFTALDICSRWPFALKHFPRRQALEALEEQHKSAAASLRYAERVVVTIFRSVCTQLKHLPTDVALGDVMRSMLCDIELINSVCFEGAVDLAPLLNDNLVQNILAMERIDALAALLSAKDSSAVCKCTISSLVLEVFKEAVYGTNNVVLADNLQMLLTPYFPELNQEFVASKSFMDAAAHTRDLLQDNSVSFSPRALREVPPLDVIETILDHSPFCFIQHCMKWRDPEWSRQANEQIREHLNSGTRNPSCASELPPLPGLPVYHLAQLLSLEGCTSVIAVKSRVVHHAVRCGEIAAAAAVCRTLLVDSIYSDPDPSINAVAEIVTNASYSDYRTKRELCEAVFYHFTKPLSRVGIETFNAIVAVWVSTGGHNRENHTVIDNLFADTSKNYDTDMEDLFRTLKSQCLSSSVDDKLLETLARYTMFWCISLGTERSDSANGRFQTSMDSTAQLCLSLLLYFSEGEQIERSGSELQGILAEQKARASRETTRNGQPLPQQDIVAALKSRGYSEHGAIRAAVATDNAGSDQALQWAIANSMKAEFDEPLVFLHNSAVVSDPFDLDRVEMALFQLMNTPPPDGSSMQSQSQDNLRNPAFDDDDGWSDFDDDESSKDAKNVQPDLRVETMPPSLPPGQKTEPEKASSFKPTGISSTTPGTSRSFPSFSDPSPRNAALPRSMLLQVGQAAFQSAKKVKSPANEERQRLIEQGRAFFKQVHHASTESLGKPKNEERISAAVGNGGDEWDFEDDISF